MTPMVKVPAGGAECRGCRHYYVTHESTRPHGCRHFGFVSRRIPAQEVVSASGEPCRAFDAHRSPPASRGPSGPSAGGDPAGPRRDR